MVNCHEILKSLNLKIKVNYDGDTAISVPTTHYTSLTSANYTNLKNNEWFEFLCANITNFKKNVVSNINKQLTILKSNNTSNKFIIII